MWKSVFELVCSKFPNQDFPPARVQPKPLYPLLCSLCVNLYIGHSAASSKLKSVFFPTSYSSLSPHSNSRAAKLKPADRICCVTYRSIRSLDPDTAIRSYDTMQGKPIHAIEHYNAMQQGQMLV